jgi:monooxygenase
MSVQHIDVLIVGAGLSGIGAAHYLQQQCPGKTYAILEGRDAIGGTWDLFRYPGIRSDSDMYTLGYAFKPWTSAKAIADGPSILEYVRETARENGIDRHIRFGHKVVSAQWSSDEALWHVEAERSDDGQRARFSCSFLYMCSGYYNYENGYTPDFEGTDRFQGQIVHPQHWPENLDYSGKRVVVIGSGATAVTLVPSMTDKAAHVTMLQRSPSYVLTLPGEDKIANGLRRVLPSMLAYGITRWKNVFMSMFFYQLCRRRPEMAKKLLRKGVASQLGKDFDVDTHFRPSYNPWDQRVCFVPDGDMFRALRKGSASIVTDHIDTFTEKGIRLKSGRELEADIIVTATGLQLLAMGGVQLSVDGEAVELSKRFAYKGMMLSGVPNFALAIGYTNASWTLKADLTSMYVCRVLNHMDKHGYAQCAPRVDEASMVEEPLIDFSSSYILRAIDSFPKQGRKTPWRVYQNYLLDLLNLKYGKVDDEAMDYRRRPAPASRPAVRKAA